MPIPSLLGREEYRGRADTNGIPERRYQVRERKKQVVRPHSLRLPHIQDAKSIAN